VSILVLSNDEGIMDCCERVVSARQEDSIEVTNCLIEPSLSTSYQGL
jgi:hypothetical protein